MFENLLSGFGSMMGGGDKEKSGGMGGAIGMVMGMMGGKEKMFNMVLDNMGNPETQEVIIDKIKEMFEFCKGRVDATSIDQVTIFIQMRPGDVQKDAEGNIILDENNKPKVQLEPFWVIQGPTGKVEKLNLRQVLTLAKDGISKFKETVETETNPNAPNGPAPQNAQAPSPQ